MLLGTDFRPGATCSFPYAFTTLRPYRSRALTITAAVKKRPPAQRSASKQRPGAKSPQKSSPAPGRVLGGLFGGAKKAAANPKQAARKATKEVKKAAPVKKAIQAGTKRVGGSQKIGGTKKIGTKRTAGTSKIGVKRTGAPPAGRIKLDDNTSSTLGAAGVFSLGLATAAFLLFSVFTGIEGTAEAEQVIQSATQSVKSAVQEVASVADSAANQEDTKVAELADKAKEAASQVPSQARSAPSPQVADQSPTGKAGIFGFGEQKPSAAEDSQVPSVVQDTKEAVEGKNPTPTSTKASDSSSQANPAFNIANLFGQAKNEVGSVAAADTADNQEDTKVAELAEKAKEAASQVPSQARSAPSPQVADASPTGKAGIFGFGEQKPSAAEDSQVPSVVQDSKEAVEGKNPTPTSTNPVKKAGNEVAKVADDTPVEEAKEAVRTLIPSPDGLIDKEKAAKNAESQEKRAVDAPESSFSAASPVGGQGEISNLADQGLKGGKAFEEAAAKLKGTGAEQFQKATEVDKQLQAEDDFKRAAQFRADAPGSKSGNSVQGRKELTSSTDAVPQGPSASLGGKTSAAPAPTNTNVLIAGGLVVAGVIAAAASQGSGGAEAVQQQAGQAAESVKKEASSAAASASNGGTGDVKEDIASRKKDAQGWISDWKSRTGGK